MIMAWIIVSALGAPAPFIEKQIRVEPAACHLPSVKGEYPIEVTLPPSFIHF
jgi:hypothetical protein